MSRFMRISMERSNHYSSSKFTNWTLFDPYDSEISVLLKTCSLVETLELEKRRISIFIAPLHQAFVRPFSKEDVCNILKKIPQCFIDGLEAVYLLGGNSKQDKVSSGKLFRYGCYGNCAIYLHPFPGRMLSKRLKKLPKPDVLREYIRVGAKCVHAENGFEITFDNESLRNFYLYDVLLHEIGHHVDRRNWRDRKSAEKYAEWFALAQSRKIVNE